VLDKADGGFGQITQVKGVRIYPIEIAFFPYLSIHLSASYIYNMPYRTILE
jgi:hypothetical protein